MVHLDAITYRYPDVPTPVLHGMTVDFEPGEIAWLYGRSGAGASTLLAVIAGVAPRHLGGTLVGRVRSNGVDPGRQRPPRTALVLPSPTLQLSGVAETVWEEIAFSPANLGWPLSRIRHQVAESIERLHLDHLIERNPATLSGGETQRVILASLAATRPDLWLLDEPATALDGDGRRCLAGLLQAEARRGATVIVASDDADLYATIAHRCVFLDGGRIVLDARPLDVMRSEVLRTSGVGSTTVGELAWAVAGLNPAQAGPISVTEEEAIRQWKR